MTALERINLAKQKNKPGSDLTKAKVTTPGVTYQETESGGRLLPTGSSSTTSNVKTLPTARDTAMEKKAQREDRYASSTVKEKKPTILDRLTTPAESGIFEGVSVLGSSPKDALRSAGYSAERYGAALLGAVEDVTDFAGVSLGRGIKDIFTLGGILPDNPNSQIGEDIANHFLNTSPTKAWEDSIESRYNPSKGAENITSFGQNVVRMLPAIGTGTAISNSGEAINAASSALKGSNIGRAIFGVQAAGSGANEAASEGATTDEAFSYGAASGLLESSIESLSGGIPALGKGVVSEAVQKVVSSPAVSRMLDIAGEGGEEAISTIITPYVKRAIYDSDAKNATADEIAQSALMGMAAAGVLQAGIELPSTVSDVIETRRAVGSKQDVIDRINRNINNIPVPDNPLVGMLPTVEDAFTYRPGSPYYSGEGDVRNLQTASDFYAQSTSENTGVKPPEYTQEEANQIRHEGKTFRNLVSGIDTTISRFFDRWKNGRKNQAGEKLEKLYIGKMSDSVGAQVSDILGYDVSERDFIITNDDVKHIIDQHGDPETEIRKGNLPLESWVFESLPEVLSNPDSITAGHEGSGKKNAGKTGLVFSKTFPNGRVVSVQFDNRGRGTLEVTTLYVKEGNTTSEMNADQTAPIGTSETPEPVLPSTTIIPESSDVVNDRMLPTAEEYHGLPTGVGPESSVQNYDNFGRNTVGAAERNIKSEPKISKVETNTFEKGGIYNEVNKEIAGIRPEDLSYDPISERQSMSNAMQRLSNDFEGERFELPIKESWSGEDLDTAMGILRWARQQGKESGDYSEFKRWRKIIQEKGTNAGQMIQAFAKYSRTPEGILMEAEQTLDDINMSESKRNEILKDVEMQVNELENLNEGDLESLIRIIEINSQIRRTTGLFSKNTAKTMDWALRQVAQKYQDAETFLHDVAVAQIRSIANDYKPISPLEAVKSFRVMGMLSKANTIMRNLTSNNVFDPLESLSNNIAVPIDIALSKITGQRTTTIDRSWFSKEKRSGSLEGLLKSYIQVGLDADIGNAKGRYEGVGGRTFKMTGNFFERLLSTWAKYQGYALKTTDEFQKGGIRAETQRGINELKSSGKLQENALSTWADETALQRTFQNNGAVAKAMTGLRSAASQIGLKDSKGGSFGVGDLTLPFAVAPANIVAQSANYSPLGLANGIRGIAQTFYEAKKGTLSPEKQAQSVRNVGRGITGSAALAGFCALAFAGLISVSDSDDKDKQALERSQGKTGTQWNLSATLRWLNGENPEWKDGDMLLSVGFLEPINAIMAAGALMADAYQQDGTISLKDVVESSASATFQAVLDLPAMSSISSMIDAYTYAEGENTAEKAFDAAISYGGSQVSSFLIPNVVKGIATGLDDTVRNQYSGDTSMQNAFDSVIAGIPGLRKELPASLDNFGREKTNTGNTLWNMLNSNLLPGQLQTYKQNAVEKELERLWNTTQSSEIYPEKSAPSTIKYDGNTYELDSDQRDTYQKIRGQTALQIMEGMIDTKDYQNASDKEKTELLEEVIDFATDAAKQEVLQAKGVKYENGLLKKADEAKQKFGISTEKYLIFALKYGSSALSGDRVKKAYDAGIQLEDYLDYSAQDKDYDQSGGVSQAEKIISIENSGLNQDEKNALYYVEDISEAGLRKWERAKEWGMSEDDYIKFYAIYAAFGDGMTKSAKIKKMQEAGMTLQQANYFWNLMKRD